MKILVTGSEGFIGRHVVRKLIAANHMVKGVDCFDPQVHNQINDRVEILKHDNYTFQPMDAGGVNPTTFSEVDAVIHLAARVGVGQSMYEINRYVSQNSEDTARMLGKLTHYPPKRLVVASSMSIYGEGAVQEFWHNRHDVAPRLDPVATPETYPPHLQSIYALTKYDQEQLCLIWGRAYNVPTVALRFFNTYGQGQALSNPYTGVMAIFASRLLNGKPPLIYEDGEQTRDFIHVDDVANAVVHAATSDMESGAYNVGTGVATSVKQMAIDMAFHLQSNGVVQCPYYTGTTRAGDIRHCFADNSKLRATGWQPAVKFADGIREYCQWLRTQPVPTDKVEAAHAELEAAGLVK